MPCRGYIDRKQVFQIDSLANAFYEQKLKWYAIKVDVVGVLAIESSCHKPFFYFCLYPLEAVDQPFQHTSLWQIGVCAHSGLWRMHSLLSYFKSRMENECLWKKPSKCSRKQLAISFSTPHMHASNVDLNLYSKTSASFPIDCQKISENWLFNVFTPYFVGTQFMT